MNQCLFALTACLAAFGLTETACIQASEPLAIENGQLCLSFDGQTGTLIGLENKLAGEIYQVRGDEFEVEAVEFCVGRADLQLTSCQREKNGLKSRYEGAGTGPARTNSLCP